MADKWLLLTGFLFPERDLSNKKVKDQISTRSSADIHVTEDVRIDGIELFDRRGAPTDRTECLKPARVLLRFTVLQPLKRINFMVGMHTTDFIYLTANNTVDEIRNYEPGPHTLDLDIKSMTLLPGVYCIRIWMGTPEGKISYHGENLFTFQVYSEDHLITRQQELGLFYLDATWGFDENNGVSLAEAPYFLEQSRESL